MIRIFHKLYHDLEIPTECELFRLWHLRQSSLLRSGTLRTEAEEWTTGADHELVASIEEVKIWGNKAGIF